MPVTYDVEIYRLNIASQFLRGGQGYRWLDTLRLKMHRACVSAAPMRLGTIKGLHRSTIVGRNQYAADAQISNLAEHAGYVHGGTGDHYGPGWRVLPPGGPGRNSVSPYVGKSFGKKAVKKVAGQKSNPWIEDACTRISQQAGAIRIS